MALLGTVVTYLSLEALDEASEDYDRSVRVTEDVDRFCSSSFWILPAARWLHEAPASGGRILREGDAWALFIGASHLHPLETMWGLPSPLIGPSAEETVSLFSRLARDARRPIVVTGLSPRSRFSRLVVERSQRDFALFRGPVTRRYVAAIGAGIEDYMGRRSADFRKSLRRARRRCDEAAIRFEIADGDDPEASFERLLAIERRSWKGMRGVGIDSEPMLSFYRDMNRRLAERGSRRLAFATRPDEKEALAYILGGVLDDTYRGLQFSFDHRYRELSLGNICQLNEIERLSRAGVRRYDLGTEVRYKRRWADHVVPSEAFILHPR